MAGGAIGCFDRGGTDCPELLVGGVGLLSLGAIIGAVMLSLDAGAAAAASSD